MANTAAGRVTKRFTKDKYCIMSKLSKVLDLLMSDIAVSCYAIAVVVFAKGLPVIGGVGLGIAVTKLWSAIADQIK